MLNVPLNQTDYNTEVNTIKYIAQENVYNSQLIESLIKNPYETISEGFRKLIITQKSTQLNTKSIEGYIVNPC